jgi:hypothetical protein
VDGQTLGEFAVLVCFALFLGVMHLAAIAWALAADRRHRPASQGTPGG